MLNVVAICQDFHTLPDPGSLLQQDVLFVYLLKWVRIFTDEKIKLEEHKAKSKKPGA